MAYPIGYVIWKFMVHLSSKPSVSTSSEKVTPPMEIAMRLSKRGHCLAIENRAYFTERHRRMDSVRQIEVG